MIDITHNKYIPDTLKISYRFQGLEYLVADKYGNFFNLNHCSSKRTQPFKLLKKSKYRVNYNGTPYSFSTLRNIHIKVNEKILI